MNRKTFAAKTGAALLTASLLATSIPLGATAASLLLALHSYFKLFPLVSCLPFYDYGFGWLIPAIVGGVLGWLLSKPDSAGAEQ